MPAANTGDLRFRIRFEKSVAVSDEGGTTTKWVEQFQRSADIRPLKGSEPVIAQRLVGVQPILIIVRYDSQTRQIDATWRAVEVAGGKDLGSYAIKSAADMERERAFVTIVAESGVADGG